MQFKSLAGQMKSYKDAINIILSRIQEGVNALSTHSVNGKKSVLILLRLRLF